MFKFNIGSAVQGVDKVISDSTVLHLMQYAGFADAEIIKTEMSDTETTYVVTAAGFNDWLNVGHEAAVYAVCEALQQDSIAYKILYRSDCYCGFLVGPKAEDWGGEFKQEYFIE